MKRLVNKKPKHRQTGKVLPDRVPAYHSSGLKTYVRHLPPMRDDKKIDTRLLAKLINERTNGNLAVITPGGFILNQNHVMIEQGIAICEQLKIRFSDVWQLMLELKKEKLLRCDIEELRIIKKVYFDSK